VLGLTTRKVSKVLSLNGLSLSASPSTLLSHGMSRSTVDSTMNVPALFCARQEWTGRILSADFPFFVLRPFMISFAVLKRSYEVARW